MRIILKRMHPIDIVVCTLLLLALFMFPRLMFRPRRMYTVADASEWSYPDSSLSRHATIRRPVLKDQPAARC